MQTTLFQGFRVWGSGSRVFVTGLGNSDLDFGLGTRGYNLKALHIMKGAVFGG